MTRWRVRFTVGRLMLAVAIAALPLAIWSAWFDPVLRWQRALHDDQDGPGRWQALSIASTLDRATVLDTLLGAARSPSRRVRETAVVGLGRLGHAGRPAAPALFDRLADPDAWIRALAAAQLGRVLPPGDPAREDAAVALGRLLGDRSSQVRLKAACTLAEFGRGGEALPTLLETLRTPDYLDQCDALAAIGRLGPPFAPNFVGELRALESRAEAIPPPDLSRLVRVYGAGARYLLGDRDSAKADLLALAEAADVDIAREARRILASLPPEDLRATPASAP